MIFWSLLALASWSHADVVDNSIADAKLAVCISETGKKNGWKTPEEFTKLVCHNKGIVSLEGLEQYTKLSTLSLHKNRIKNVDLSYFPRLKSLNLARNELQTLKVVGLLELEEFFVFSNVLTSLLLRDLPKLESFRANSNKIVAFEYSGVPALEKIYLFDNALEHIDIDVPPNMRYMDVRQNPMPDELYEEMDKRSGVTILHDGNADDWN